MAEDPALPLTDVQLVLGHAQLTTTQIYLTPRKEEVIRRVLAHHARADPAGGCAGTAGPGARLPARDAGRAVPERCVVTATAAEPAPLVRTAPTGRARQRAPVSRPGPCPPHWPATGQSREAGAGAADRAPFVAGNARTEKIRRRGLTFLLDWLEDQPGATWQERWLASGADSAGAGLANGPGRAGCTSQGLFADWRQDALASALLGCDQR